MSLSENDVRRIVREEIRRDHHIGQEARKLLAVGVGSRDALFQAQQRVDEQHLGSSDIQVGAPEVVVVLEQVQGIDKISGDGQPLGNVGETGVVHGTSPSVGESSTPTVGERQSAGKLERFPADTAEGGANA